MNTFEIGFDAGWRARESKLATDLVPSSEYQELKPMHMDRWMHRNKSPEQLEMDLTPSHELCKHPAMIGHGMYSECRSCGYVVYA